MRELRSQLHHVIDITPTILEATGITLPTEVNGVKQQKIESTSLVYTFDDPDASSQRKTQYLRCSETELFIITDG